MTPRQLVESQLKTSAFLFEGGLKDLSDADVRSQPIPGANHVVWILKHLAVSEDAMLHTIVGGGKKLPDAMHAAYKGGSTPDPRDPTTKDDAWKAFLDSRERVGRVLAEFPESQWDAPLPPGSMPMFKTKGEFWGLLAAHPYWHFGQLTDVRKALGKPPVLG